MLEAYLNILVIFSIILVGYILSWKQWFDNHIADVFSKIVLNMALPLNMFLNMTQKFSKEEFLSLFKGLVLPATSIVVTFGISWLYATITRVPDTRKGTFQTMFTAANTIFMGLPVTVAVFGEKAIPYALLYYMCNTTFFFTLGLMLMSSDHPERKFQHQSVNLLVLLKKLFSPALMGFIVGLLWLLLELPLFKPLIDFSRHLGNLTTPLSLFVIGIIVYQTGVRHLRIDKDVFGVLIGRYVISPLVVYGLSFIFPVPSLMLKVFIIQSAMPVQNSIPILARGYQVDEKFATSGLIFSVLSYLFVIIIYLFLLIGLP